MFQHLIDEITGLNVTFASALFRLTVSMILGVMIGAERKRKGQVAGMRTFALISMGATMAMLISIYVPQEYLGLKNGDPGRIAAQVITGVGFLGGGAMIHLRGAVRGLTTAAGIWMTSIMGMAVGVGMYGAAVASAVLSLIVLQGFEAYEHWRHLGHDSRIIKLKVDGIVNDIDSYSRIFDSNNIHLSTYFINYDYDENATEISFIILSPSHVNLLNIFPQLSKVYSTKSLTLSSQS